MLLAATVALVTHLNAVRHGAESIEVAAAVLTGAGPIQHVLDPEGLLGLDPLNATDLRPALTRALRAATHHGYGWQLALPRPGRLEPLRGPAALTERSLLAEAAAVPTGDGVAWVPWAVGPAVQWQLTPAHRPAAAPGRAEAERSLSELIVSGGRRLTELGVVAGRRPVEPTPISLAPGYPGRHRRAAERAVAMLTVVQAARDSEADLLHVHAVGVRAGLLSDLEAAAIDVLCAACAWPG